jgi:hypothetical protein
MATQNAINANASGIVGYDGAGTFSGSALTTNAVVYAGSAHTLTSQALTNGQLQIGNTGTFPTAAALTAGTGISITNGSGSITINAIGTGATWTVVTGATQTMAVNNGYISNATAGGVTYTLPTTAVVGAAITVTGLAGSSGWTINQNTGQSIQFGRTTTTVTTGSLASTFATDTVVLVCAVANDTFIVVDSIGNITVV